MANKTDTKAYEASSIQVLEGMEAIRKRPGMYVGSTGSEGLFHLLLEMVDNAVDEACEGHGEAIHVVLHGDGSYEVSDEGRGVPVGLHNGSDKSALEVIFTQLHAGGKFNTESYGASGGLHGVGAAVVNALSTKVKIEVYKGKKIHRLDFLDQKPGILQGNGKFKPGSEINTTNSKAAAKTGTKVRWWPDLDLFAPSAHFSFEEVSSRLLEMSWLLPNVEFTLRDEREGENKKVTHRSQRGLLDALEKLAEGTTTIGSDLRFEGEGKFEEIIPVNDKMMAVERNCKVEVAARWVDKTLGDPPITVSFVNTIPTPDGGTHVAGLHQSIVNEVRNEIKIRSMRKLAALKGIPATKDDCLTGLIAVLRVQVPEPQFRGQTKKQLGTTEVQGIVKDVVAEQFNDWLSGKSKSSRKTDVNAVIEHVTDIMVARFEAAKSIAEKKRHKQLSVGALPAKLADCRKHPGGELLIVEGDSAAGPCKRTRDSAWQAVLPLRGKILNAAKATKKAVLDNTEAAALIQSIGAGFDKTFDIDRSRYTRIVLLTDADVDGSHIRCLTLTLFWHYMRPLLEEGRVYSCEPPTHSISVGSEKIFVWSEDELAKKSKELSKKKKSFQITRFKGLGEMDDEELYETSLNPESRNMRRISVKEAESANVRFDITMGNDVEQRKQFIIENSSKYGHALDI